MCSVLFGKAMASNTRVTHIWSVAKLIPNHIQRHNANLGGKHTMQIILQLPETLQIMRVHDMIILLVHKNK